MFDTTIIIPARNRAFCIGRAIESALAQHCSAHEILVIDDSSTDGTAEVAEKYGKPVRVIRLSGESYGPARPRNIGINAARTEYITFLDSDDYIASELLEIIRECAMKVQDFGIISSNWVIAEMRTESGTTLKSINEATVVHGLPKKEILPKAYLVESTYCYPALLCQFFLKMNGTTVPKRIAMESGLFNESLRLGGDFDLWLRILRHKPLIYIDRPLQYVVRHSGNISSSSIEANPDKELEIMRTYTNILEEHYASVNNRMLRGRVGRRIKDLRLMQVVHLRNKGLTSDSIRMALRAFSLRSIPTLSAEIGKSLFKWITVSSRM